MEQSVHTWESYDGQQSDTNVLAFARYTHIESYQASIYNGSEWIYVEFVVDSGATCQLIGEDLAQYVTNQQQLELSVTGFQKNQPVKASVRGDVHPFFILASKEDKGTKGTRHFMST